MLWHAAAAGLLAAAMGFAGGWQVRAWKAGADDTERVLEDQRLARIARDRSKENVNDLRKNLERARAHAATGDA